MTRSTAGLDEENDEDEDALVELEGWESIKSARVGVSGVIQDSSRNLAPGA